MHAGHDVPNILLARIRSAGGPFRVDDAIAIAYEGPTVGRLVALDAMVRVRCGQYERTTIPEIVSAVVEYAVAPYVTGETLTLYFVDPAIARIGRDAPQAKTDAGRGGIVVVAPAREGAVEGSGRNRRDSEAGVSYLAEESRLSQPQLHAGDPMTLRENDRMTDARTPNERLTEERPASARVVDERVVDERFATERVADERQADERTPSQRAADGNGPSVADGHRPNERAAVARRPDSLVPPVATPEKQREHSSLPDFTRGAEAGIVVRLEWSAQRVQRFIQVVDRLFTIDRLGWYRHSLAMRLLIPDEIRSGDELADLEAMRHLHALRSAAVSALGKPLLAACMPGFAVTGDWLETLESSREARAIAGLRDALLPYATDPAGDTNDRSAAVEPGFTVGAVSKRALLAESATSVESFLPILIPTRAHDAVLYSRLTDYRNLLVELFAQTARATDPVRLGALAQPNHSLDDRLWQLVGAVGQAFGGFVHS